MALVLYIKYRSNAIKLFTPLGYRMHSVRDSIHPNNRRIKTKLSLALLSKSKTNTGYMYMCM